MPDKDFDKINLHDKIRVVTGMIRDLDSELRAHFYKSMLQNPESSIFKDKKLEYSILYSLEDVQGISANELHLINDIANSMDEIGFLLEFENLLINP